MTMPFVPENYIYIYVYNFILYVYTEFYIYIHTCIYKIKNSYAKNFSSVLT